VKELTVFTFHDVLHYFREAKKLLHNYVIYFYAQFRTVHEECMAPENGVEMLSRNVGTEIPFYAA
jgi:hypothetical protein